ncbi:MAG: c-type cytochrome [Parachlamydiaceae bacterium]
MRSDTPQILLIVSGVIVALLIGVFFYRELFPEYKIYQHDYVALEEFRSLLTHEPAPFFQTGIKQLVLERDDKGPATIDRCISCHVALQIPYFSPKKIAYDLNGNLVRDEKGHPLLIANEDYIWGKLNTKIAELRDEKVLEELNREGKTTEIAKRLNQASQYAALKTAKVGEHVYDVTKALSMHPLMGNETYPFQYHPIEEYGCTSCHNGNGRGLVTDKAHGPVFDQQYAIEEVGHSPAFREHDPKNDPRFAHVFNHKPGEELIFQTEPIFVGSLIQAKCMQCHQDSHLKVAEAQNSLSNFALIRKKQLNTLADAFENEKEAALDLLTIGQHVKSIGYQKTVDQLKTLQSDYSLRAVELQHMASQEKYLTQAAKGETDDEAATVRVLKAINEDLIVLLGSASLVDELNRLDPFNQKQRIEILLEKNRQTPQAKGNLFAKANALEISQQLMRQADQVEKSVSKTIHDTQLKQVFTSDIDRLTQDYHRGKELYISQACYACHRITGFSRGGVGPELTRAGDNYPWYLKRKLMWPQGDLPTSTMPNMHFDSEEIEDLMTFLLSQKGESRAISKTDYQSNVQAWEVERKMPWESPLPPADIYDLRKGMTLFATQGCAACHRLQGFESNVGFAIEKTDPSTEQLYEQQNWFKKLFPEVVAFGRYDTELPGSEIVETLEKHAQKIDEQIVDDVRQNAILEEIDKLDPEVLESFYSPFRYASRAKNTHYQSLIDKETDPIKIALLEKEWEGWKNRVHRVLMVYIQTYGLGRLIGPHLNWSGIYRSDEWLMEHFYHPSGHIPRSMMPVFPFDQTKFLALTHMLDVLAVRNRDSLRKIWDLRGFNPEEAYNMLCAQCHGINRLGNGVIAEWIYPIAKNLHNQDFLRNLTQDKAFESIYRGVKGTPMPAWGEAAEGKAQGIKEPLNRKPLLNEGDIHHLVDWIFSGLPGAEVIRQSSDVPKWQYQPEDVLKELKREGGRLEGTSDDELQQGKKESLSTLWISQKIAVSSMIPSVSLMAKSKKKEDEADVDTIFDIIPSSFNPKVNDSFIKKRFFTPYNIEKGKEFFFLNCAVCHGSEADGSGTRAQAMQEAKPRMLTNLDWLDSHDDLRLLRSIKFGVPGTSMTPWGDLTSALQRLQLVIFIRSLTKEQEMRNQLAQILYRTFDESQFLIEEARSENSKQIEELQQQGGMQLENKIHILEKKEEQLLELKTDLKEERNLYLNLGLYLMGKDLPDSAFASYLDLIGLNRNRYAINNKQLTFDYDEKIMENIRSERKKIMAIIDDQIVKREEEKQILKGRISSPEVKAELNNKRSEIDSYQKLKAKLMTDSEEALRLALHQKRIFHMESSESLEPVQHL